MSGLVAGPGEPGNVEPAERNGEGIGKCGLCSRVAAVGDNGEITVGLGELDILVLGERQGVHFRVRYGSISGPASSTGDLS